MEVVYIHNYINEQDFSEIIGPICLIVGVFYVFCVRFRFYDVINCVFVENAFRQKGFQKAICGVKKYMY